MKVNPQAIVETKFFNEKTKELTRAFFAVRLLVFFIVLPLLDLLWTRATYTDVSMDPIYNFVISALDWGGLTA
jgi:hypothetical protein